MSQTQQENFDKKYLKYYNIGITNKEVLKYIPGAMERTHGFFDQYLKEKIKKLIGIDGYVENLYNMFKKEPSINDFYIIDNDGQNFIVSDEEAQIEFDKYKNSILSVNKNGLDWYNKIWEDCKKCYNGVYIISSIDDFYKRICNLIVNCEFYNTEYKKKCRKYFVAICSIITEFVGNKINRIKLKRKRKEEKDEKKFKDEEKIRENKRKLQKAKKIERKYIKIKEELKKMKRKCRQSEIV